MAHVSRDPSDRSNVVRAECECITRVNKDFSYPLPEVGVSHKQVSTISFKFRSSLLSVLVKSYDSSASPLFVEILSQCVHCACSYCDDDKKYVLLVSVATKTVLQGFIFLTVSLLANFKT